MLYYVILCYIMLYYIILYYNKQILIQQCLIFNKSAGTINTQFVLICLMVNSYKYMAYLLLQDKMQKNRYIRMSIDNQVQKQMNTQNNNQRSQQQQEGEQEYEPMPVAMLRNKSSEAKSSHRPSSLKPKSTNRIHYINTEDDDFKNNGHLSEMLIDNEETHKIRSKGGYKSDYQLVKGEGTQNLSMDYQQDNHNRITFNNRMPPVQNRSMLYSYNPISPVGRQQRPLTQKNPISPINRINKKSGSKTKTSPSQIREVLRRRKSKQTLEQAVEDLQLHNKNMMQETRRTVEQFQNYIELLLEENYQLQVSVSECENYLNQLQNQKMQMIEDQKRRQLTLKTTITQKINIQKQLKSVQAQNQAGQMELRYKIQDINSLKEQIQRKSKMVKLLEQAIQQKQQNIRKMAQFNNEVCMENMELKNKKVQLYTSSIQKNLELNSLVQLQKAEQQKRYRQSQNKILQLKHENENLRKINKNLQQEVTSLLNNDKKMLNHIKNQEKKLQLQQKNNSRLLRRLKLLDKKGENQEQINENSLNLQDYNVFQLQPIPNRRYDRLNQIQNREATFRALDRKNSAVSKQQSISQISRKQIEFRENKGNMIENRSQGNLITYLQENQQIEGDQNQNSLGYIKDKNDQILRKINQIRKKIKNHVPDLQHLKRSSSNHQMQKQRQRQSGRQFAFNSTEYAHNSGQMGKNTETTKSCDALNANLAFDQDLRLYHL